MLSVAFLSGGVAVGFICAVVVVQWWFFLRFSVMWWAWLFFVLWSILLVGLRLERNPAHIIVCRSLLLKSKAQR